MIRFQDEYVIFRNLKTLIFESFVIKIELRWKSAAEFLIPIELNVPSRDTVCANNAPNTQSTQSFQFSENHLLVLKMCHFYLFFVTFSGRVRGLMICIAWSS